MLATPFTRRLGPDRAVPASLAIAAVCACATLAIVDPDEGGLYPTCPTRTLLGIDCPACGTLRGLHDAFRGRIGDALGHNVLLLVALPVGVAIWLGWVGAALGRPMRSRELPSWAVPAVVVVATAFAIARNLPVETLRWLDSA